MPLVRAAIAILALGGAACSPTAGPSASPTSLADPALGSRPPVATASAAPIAAPTVVPSAAPDGTLTASSDGVSVRVTLASTEVAPGRNLKIAITIDNARPVPLLLESQYCGAPALFTALGHIPVDPVGRTWGGLAGDLKSFALGQAEQQGEIGPTPIGTVATTCSDDRGWVVTVPAGGTTTTSMPWRAELVDGVLALP